MHDDLIGAAARRSARWSFLGVLVAAIGPAGAVGIVAGPVAGAIAYPVVVAVVGAWLQLGAPGLLNDGAALPKGGLRPADGVVANVAEALALASGSAPVAAYVLDHRQPNVAAPSSHVVVVTTAAVALLSRDELEAVCAVQLAIARDPACRRIDGRLSAWRLARSATLGASVPLLVVCAVTGLVVPVVVTLVPVVLAGQLVAGKLKWWSAVGADGVCVATTKHPAALVSALRRLSLWNGAKVPVGWMTQVTGAGASS